MKCDVCNQDIKGEHFTLHFIKANEESTHDTLIACVYFHKKCSYDVAQNQLKDKVKVDYWGIIGEK